MSSGGFHSPPTRVRRRSGRRPQWTTESGYRSRATETTRPGSSTHSTIPLDVFVVECFLKPANAVVIERVCCDAPRPRRDSECPEENRRAGPPCCRRVHRPPAFVPRSFQTAHMPVPCCRTPLPVRLHMRLKRREMEFMRDGTPTPNTTLLTIPEYPLDTSVTLSSAACAVILATATHSLTRRSPLHERSERKRERERRTFVCIF